MAYIMGASIESMRASPLMYPYLYEVKLLVNEID
jgi:hypothetical protein